MAPANPQPELYILNALSPRMRMLFVVKRGLADAVRQALEQDGHSLALAQSGRHAVQMAQAFSFDAMVVDTAPGLDGFEVVRMLRGAGVRAPILMLIAKDAVRDAGKVPEAGADDFLIKPFSLVEFLARLHAMFGRGPRESPRLHIADLVMDTSTLEVSRGGAPVALTHKEFQLLEILVRNSGRVVHRGELIEALWAGTKNVESNTLDAFIRLLRRKIDRGRELKLIHTVRGFGYRVSGESK